MARAYLTERYTDDAGALVLVTETRGKDDGCPTDIQTIYIVSEKDFRMRKNVKFDGEDAFSNRNEYRFGR